MFKSKRKFFLVIHWGEMPDCGNEEHYIFDTEAERNAFMLGVAEADGWQGWDVRREGYYDE